MEKQIPMVIYRCRRCGKEFETDGTIGLTGIDKVNDIEVPTNSVWKYHQCDDGVFGMGDLIAGYMKPKKNTISKGCNKNYMDRMKNIFHCAIQENEYISVYGDAKETANWKKGLYLTSSRINELCLLVKEMNSLIINVMEKDNNG